MVQDVNGRLPDFVIAGAPRSGTTALARYLGAHPSIFIAQGKELRFFDTNYSKGLTWYQSHFDDAPEDSLCGEASPWYMFDPVTIDRMYEHLPGAQVIASLREPSERVWSHYWMRRERDLESRPFEEVLDSEFQILEREGELSTDLFYLRGSLYAPYLRSVYEHYPRDNVHVLIFEHLITSPRKVYESLCEALGVDTGVHPDILGEPINAYVQFRSVWLRNVAKRTGNRLLQRVTGRLNARKGSDYPDLAPENRQRLQSLFASYNSELENLLMARIPEWDS